MIKKRKKKFMTHTEYLYVILFIDNITRMILFPVVYYFLKKKRKKKDYCNGSWCTKAQRHVMKLYLGSAGGVWAGGARVAWGITGVPTLRSGMRTRLLTITFDLALRTMAYSFAAMIATGQQFITDQTTGDILQVAWDITSLLERKQTSKAKRQDENIMQSLYKILQSIWKG